MRRVRCHAVPPCSLPATSDPLDDETRPLSRKVSPRHEPLHVRRDRGSDPHPANANGFAGDGQTRNNRRRRYLQNGRTKLARYSPTGHSLLFGLSAPPTASQASVPGVAIETQLCSNDAKVSGRTVAPRVAVSSFRATSARSRLWQKSFILRVKRRVREVKLDFPLNPCAKLPHCGRSPRSS